MTEQAPASADDSVRVEFIVEPFVIDDPGPHVAAAVQVAQDAGLDPDMGPFATTAAGKLDTVIDAVADLVRASFSRGATSVQFRIDNGQQEVKLGLHDALERLVASVERELGTPVTQMSRAQKQHAVGLLENQGAFLLRGSVEQVATLMNVSKVTLYTYLNAVG